MMKHLEEGANPKIIPEQSLGVPSGTTGSEVNATSVTKEQWSVMSEQKVTAQGDEASQLRALGTDVRDQDDLERDIGRHADHLLTEQAIEREQKRLEKTRADKEKLDGQVRKLQQRLNVPTGSATTARVQAEIANLEARIETLRSDLGQIQARIDQRQKDDRDHEMLLEDCGNRRMPNESRRDFLIRTGKITPFSKIAVQGLSRSGSSLQDVLFDAEEGMAEENQNYIVQEGSPVKEVLSHRTLLQPGFVDDDDTDALSEYSDDPERPRKRRCLANGSRICGNTDPDERSPSVRATSNSDESSDGGADDGDGPFSLDQKDGDITLLAKDDNSDDDEIIPEKARGRAKTRKVSNQHVENLARLDDGDERIYQERLQSWIERRSAARSRAKERKNSTITLRTNSSRLPNESLDAPIDSVSEISKNLSDDSAEEEWHKPHPAQPDTAFDGGYRIPGDIYPSLFDYQKTGVQWLWELYTQQVGGIIGDEMGLGKTIQAIAFLAGLHYSKRITKPVVVVAPATVMKQWVNEFHTWWPPFRVSILHTSGSGMMDVGKEANREAELESRIFKATRQNDRTKGQRAARRIVDRVLSDGHILVTTYSGLQTYADMLIPVDWEYAILDEGHKIRNPNTAITIFCKELRTVNRIILSGTPMQNNLIELWSLFDFIFPMRLGTLVNFRNQFEFPIRAGGYASASNLQVQTAMHCAETLKDTISPYLLQRFKVDVAADLPSKSEQVLFCKLTKLQREAYENFLGSDEMKAILNGKRQVLFGVDLLRKICNHPDLQEHRVLSIKPGYSYGSGLKSGKMQVVKALLEEFKRYGHKTLLFAQHRIMLDILEKFIKSLDGFSIRRMDGNTPIHTRQSLVDDFNRHQDIHVFLLTTKVGGLGVNLTGADRVIIYDPDWNPSTDIQARERAWRLGQKREVKIYRLMTAGTIEEKIYHRQIFKQFLTNKILRDPKQRQTFQMKDLHDLFSLGRADDGATETSELFQGVEVKFNNDLSKPTSANNGPNVLWDGLSVACNDAIDESSSVRSMAGVASLERFQGEEEQRKAVPSDATNSEARVMEGIFARSGVHSALEHDQIINGKRVITADPKIIEREAKRVAAQAANELRRAGDYAKTVPVGTPTWTGQFGTTGKPDESASRRGFGGGARRGGPASSNILAGLQARQAGNSAVASSNGNSKHESPTPRGRDFMKMIRDYLVTHGGTVHTQMLIDHFNRHCTTPERTAEFKEMLKAIAILEKGSRGRGRWVLKDEYRM